MFREAGPVFDIFLPRNKKSGKEEGLVLFVSRLNGMLIGLSKDWMEELLVEEG